MPDQDPIIERPSPHAPAIVEVAAGGLLGSACRIAVAEVFPIGAGTFPASTLGVNLAGALLLGWYLSRRERSAASSFGLRFWAIGALGAFTTFSTFSLEVVSLLDGGRVGIAATYALISTAGGLLCAFAGGRIGRAMR
jgi:fluoride exporter